MTTELFRSLNQSSGLAGTLRNYMQGSCVQAKNKQ